MRQECSVRSLRIVILDTSTYRLTDSHLMYQQTAGGRMNGIPQMRLFGRIPQLKGLRFGRWRSAVRPTAQLKAASPIRLRRIFSGISSGALPPHRLSPTADCTVLSHVRLSKGSPRTVTLGSMRKERRPRIVSGHANEFQDLTRVMHTQQHDGRR